MFQQEANIRITKSYIQIQCLNVLKPMKSKVSKKNHQSSNERLKIQTSLFLILKHFNDLKFTKERSPVSWKSLNVEICILKTYKQKKDFNIPNNKAKPGNCRVLLFHPFSNAVHGVFIWLMPDLIILYFYGRYHRSTGHFLAYSMAVWKRQS